VRILLLDGDTIVYQAGREAERATNWGDGLWTNWAEEQDGADAVDALVDRIKEGTNADRVIVALSDYEHTGWRYGVMPTYKAGRVGKKSGNGRPLLWQFLRDHFIANYETHIRPTLEGDDVLGILATHPRALPPGSEKIICSIDKDMGTIPAFHLNFTKAHTEFGWEVREVTRAQADYYHLYQSLIGDTTDGYPGCMGCGPVCGQKVLAPFACAAPESFDVAGAWKAVVAQYVKAGLTEADALTNARVARICRATDYDYVKREVILWSPPGYAIT
jgi:DNA polymerase-1